MKIDNLGKRLNENIEKQKSETAKKKFIMISEIMNILSKVYFPESLIYKDTHKALNKLSYIDIQLLWLMVITSK